MRRIALELSWSWAVSWTGWLGAVRLHLTVGCANSKRANQGAFVRIYDLRMRPRQRTHRHGANLVASGQCRYRGHYLRPGSTNLSSFQIYFLPFFGEKISYNMYLPSITQLSSRHRIPPRAQSAAEAGAMFSSVQRHSQRAAFPEDSSMPPTISLVMAVGGKKRGEWQFMDDEPAGML